MKFRKFVLIFMCIASFFNVAISAEEYPSSLSHEWVREFLTITPDFPKKGVMFISYERLLKSPDDFQRVIKGFAKRYRDKNLDAVVGLDARGFIFGSALAYELNVPFVMVRKGGKLPGKTECVEYALEYGKSVFELECNALENGERVIVIDDLLATGGTMSAACELVEKVGAVVVETACFLEIAFLKGREKVGRPFFAYLDDR